MSEAAGGGGTEKAPEQMLKEVETFDPSALKKVEEKKDVPTGQAWDMTRAGKRSFLLADIALMQLCFVIYWIY